MRFIKIFKFLLGLKALFFTAFIAAQNDVIKVYNWMEYIEPSVLEDFTAETGIKVEYHTYTNVLDLENLFADNIAADIIVPYHFMLPDLIASGKIQKLNAQKLPNRKNVNRDLLLKLQSFDAKNQYAIPYLWSVIGLAVNRPLITQTLEQSFEANWSLLFDDEKRTKLASCGISIINAPLELYTIMLDYSGKSLVDTSTVQIKNSKPKLEQLKNSAKYVDNLAYFDDLFNNNLCLAVSYSGHVMPVLAQNAQIEYHVPDDYGLLALDNLVIPNTAINVEGAHAFIDYLLRPEVAAKIVSHTKFGSGVTNLQHLVAPELQQNSFLFPDRKTIRSFDLIRNINLDQQEALNTVWRKIMQL